MALSNKLHGKFFLDYSYWGLGKPINAFGMYYWYDNDLNIKIFIPDEPYFSAIKVLVLDGKGLYESYQKAAAIVNPTGNYPLEKAYPDSTLAVPIRFYIYSAVDQQGIQAVSRPYGDGSWVHSAASKILQMYFLGALSKPGRLEIETGIILPTQEEQVCIKNQMRYEDKSINEAFSLCGCGDIIPTKYATQIENVIKSFSFTMFNSYMIAITGAQIPNKPDPDESKTDKDNKNLYYILGAGAIALMLTNK